MNFLDTYDISASSAGTSTPPPDQSQQTLNEEVNQVIGQLGRFWGGFRKQSQTVFETARRDIGDVVTQAQKELTKLASNTAEDPNAEREIRRSSSREYEEATPMSASVLTIRETNSTAATTSSSTDSSGHTDVQPQSGWNTQTLFSRLQSALPPNVVSTVQNHIPESIKHASENVDLTQIRTNLLSEVQRIQGVTRAQAEEYAHKSEALLREAVKEAQEVFKDAVKVIPPEGSSETSTSTTSGLIWDGADMWTIPGVVEATSDAADADASSGKGKGKSMDSGAAAVATRAEALLRRLKHDPAIVRVDPGIDETTKDKYTAWIQKEVVSKEGGIEGEGWRTAISKSLDDATTDGGALVNLKATLVPSELTEQEFWQRFFFRTHQIKEEEEKRKALLQANTESDEDFDWDEEDSEDEDASKREVTKEATPTQDKLMAAMNNPGTAPPSSTMSTRESSLDSFDVVSSANASVSGDPRTQHARATESDEDEDEDEEDSDWE